MLNKKLLLCFGEVGGLDYLLTFMTYCALLIFCIDDMESVLEAKNGVCLPYIASELAERLVGLIKQPTLFKSILKSLELNIWDNSAAAMSNSLG